MSLPDDRVSGLVVKRHLTDSKTLASVTEFAKAAKISLSSALIEKGILTNETLASLEADDFGVPLVSLSKLTIPADVAGVIPLKTARAKKAIVFARDREGVKVAMNNPKDTTLLSMVARKTGERAIPYFATSDDIDRTLQIYRKPIDKTITELLAATAQKVPGIIPDAPVAKIVDELIYAAYQDKASDIHVEPEKETVLIRFRIDGVLRDMIRLQKVLHDRVITRIKVLSNLRTDEHLSAQDGKMRMELSEEDLDIRVSIIPVTFGEKAVLRLLSSRSREYTLRDLGMNEADLAKVTDAMNKSHGMILSCGPTGSGKTTTIYAILKVLNVRDKNITTIEDPIEYRIGGANQVQVNAKTDLTFANGLRSILRQDPNIIFVGEIRDNETAGIAVNAGLTGHLVLSTLHTNDAATAIPRLIDMHVEPYLVASTVNVIVAQRLVRKICQFCKAGTKVTAAELKKNIPVEIVNKHLGTKSGTDVFVGQGCKLCNGTGYSGRIGIFEVLEITKEIRKLIVERTDSEIIEQAARGEGMVMMLDDGLGKVIKGSTTIEEILRATRVEFE
ncbi:hypothetical protein A2630_01020 [Candidatus Woesebacteria bacterium RIFCSPHIGHO2_01_FULL_44_10]|uniref:AAA+ ATPase domain-containing protein n=1 Tax=Candidatus Woesebacteria bacterium RIFCSPLOWO2_01_FULL_44_14 TaxID=1802525 RepID=A0A1F8C2V4_9BACT|nr:MAG: hypothetical protein A2630_01020 [Candidatus Woesebacteria bacterium RIFCSPHIGHO2_01_FULL_44_10]OGM54124.1 MAG: hypothetical protein A3F62_05465 [Candidatus Woesebacteria bacterium RIFCSPHIGHO2_12_FULL_44_11]OGM70199.1 MAG: hypothetical protein A2975_03955 [Candidatus Woesebacteria bacterium RIFCSPLOWO2_01_FULL_44_14]